MLVCTYFAQSDYDVYLLVDTFNIIIFTFHHFNNTVPFKVKIDFCDEKVAGRPIMIKAEGV